MNQEYLRAALKGNTFGATLWCEDMVASTFTSMKERLPIAPHGAVLTAQEQSAGRGRMSRAWQSRRGEGLYFTLLLRPEGVPAMFVPRYTPMMAVGVCKALQGLGYDAKIKWPNDIVLGGKKVCGILCEAGFEGAATSYVMAGIGVNVGSGALDGELAEKACALADFFPIGREDLLIRILHELECATELGQRDFPALLKEYRQHCMTLGRRVVASGGQVAEGLAVDIGSECELVVQDEQGARILLRTADVSIRGGNGYV